MDHPSLIPALLLAGSRTGSGPDDLDGPLHRTARDWIVDIGLVLLSLAVGALIVADSEIHPVPPPHALLVVDLATGVLGCLLLWWRRRWPVAVALLLGVIGTYSDMVSGALLVALFTVAVHRPVRPLLLVVAVDLATFVGYVFVRRGYDGPQAVVIVAGLALMTGAVAWGLFVRARRQLVLSLRDRAVRAESEQRLRVEQARHLERARIARECTTSWPIDSRC